jgi:Uma2 family endonuclease
MSRTTAVPSTSWTAVDLARRFGPIPLSRIRWNPTPGSATEEDVLEIERHEGVLCELLDGILVEKPMGYRESILATALIVFLREFVDPRKLGSVAGEAGMIKLALGMVRIPDVSFIFWDRFPNRQLPSEPIPLVAPDLAVEILSGGNTLEEMARKRREYFDAGTQLVWMVDPQARTVTVYTSIEQCAVLHENQTLEGNPVLPGFALPLSRLFCELDPH